MDSPNIFWNRWVRELKKGGLVMTRTLPKSMVERYYAVYLRDENVFEGTLEECAAFLGIKVPTAYQYSMPVYIERNTKASRYSTKGTVLVKLDD